MAPSKKSLKELRAELKKAMPSPSKMTRDQVILMLEKHKGDEVVTPKKKLVAEHKELVDVLEKPTVKKLKKESVKQEKELKELTKPVKKLVKLPESSEDEEPIEKVKKVTKKKTESDDEKLVKVKKSVPIQDKSSSSDSVDKVDKKKAWGLLRKEGLSSAEAWAKLRE